MVHVTAIFAGEVVVFVAIVAEGYIIGVNSDVTGVNKSAAMAAGVIVTGAMATHEPIIVIHSYDVYVRHQFVAIVTIAIIVVAAILTDVVVTTYVIHGSP